MVENLVSIIMPCYNGEFFLVESINSVIKQTYQNWELLIINDNSTDNSGTIINSFSQKDNRIKYFFNEKPTGNPATARNIGIKKSKGRYIAFLDCDDIWEKNKLEKQLPLFDKNTAVVYSYYEKINGNGKRNNRLVKAPLHTSYREMLKSDVIGNLTGIYDTKKIGKVLQKEKHQEDYIMWLEILKYGYKAVCVPEVLALYRVTENSLSHSKFKHFKWQWRTYRDVLKLNIFYASYLYIYYAIKGILKYLK